jgi:DNA modification methylase
MTNKPILLNGDYLEEAKITFIGMELDESYYEIAKKRIDDATK